MRRIRRAAVIVVLTALAVALAGPASALSAVTRTQVAGSLLTATQLGAGWHRYDSSSSPAADVKGCNGASYTTVGLAQKAGRMYQYNALPTFINENVQSFRTVTGAKTDFTKGVRQFSSCSTFTVNGKIWKIARLTVPAYADQRALFKLSGPVATAAGDVPVTMFLAATRYGRQEVQVMVTVAGATTAAQQQSLATSSVRISQRATAKVAARLGR